MYLTITKNKEAIFTDGYDWANNCAKIVDQEPIKDANWFTRKTILTGRDHWVRVTYSPELQLAVTTISTDWYNSYKELFTEEVNIELDSSWKSSDPPVGQYYVDQGGSYKLVFKETKEAVTHRSSDNKYPWGW